MNEYPYLLAAVAATPADPTPQLVLADWLGERGSFAEERAWRWIATFRRRPNPFRMWRIGSEPYWGAARVGWLGDNEPSCGDGWGKWNLSGDWPWSAGMGMIPAPVFRWLPKTTVYDVDFSSNERCYEDVAEAFEALASAFVKATAPRTTRLSRFWCGPAWEPDWDAAARVPNE